LKAIGGAFREMSTDYFEELESSRAA